MRKKGLGFRWAVGSAETPYPGHDLAPEKITGRVMGQIIGSYFREILAAADFYQYFRPRIDRRYRRWSLFWTEQRILDKLIDSRPMNKNELAKKCGLHYEQVRRATQSLLSRQAIEHSSKPKLWRNRRVSAYYRLTPFGRFLEFYKTVRADKAKWLRTSLKQEEINRIDRAADLVKTYLFMGIDPARAQEMGREVAGLAHETKALDLNLVQRILEGVSTQFHAVILRSIWRCIMNMSNDRKRIVHVNALLDTIFEEQWDLMTPSGRLCAAADFIAIVGAWDWTEEDVEAYSSIPEFQLLLTKTKERILTLANLLDAAK